MFTHLRNHYQSQSIYGGATKASLTLVVSNAGTAPVTIKGINIGIPTGTDTDADALTTVPAQINPTPPPGWTMGTHKESPGLYTFVFIPPKNDATPPKMRPPYSRT